MDLKKEPDASQRREFNVGPYRCMFGPSHSPSGFSVWLWNAYYWQLEIVEAYDFDGAVNSMRFKLLG